MNNYLDAKNNGTIVSLSRIDPRFDQYMIIYKQFNVETGEETEPKTEVVSLSDIQSQLDNLQALLTDCQAQS